MRFCEWVRIRKESYGCTYSEIQRLTGIPSSTFGNHISGRKFPRKTAFLKYLKLFDFTGNPVKLYEYFKNEEVRYQNFYAEGEEDAIS